MVDCVADTVGGETAAKLFGRVKNGGNFGYASMLPDGVPERNRTVTVTRVFGRPDASKVREFADDIRDGKFLLPISRRLPLHDASEAHALAQKGGAGKIVLVCGDM
jgi:NADPH:quinone reductase-like Zn-dependent oxidoreductase